MDKTLKLKEIDSNNLGDYLEDYGNDALNKKLSDNFLVLDYEANIELILEAGGFTEVIDADVDAGIAVAEATLAEVNKVLKAQGIQWEFKSFDSADYTSYMLVNINDDIKATAQRVLDLVDNCVS